MMLLSERDAPVANVLLGNYRTRFMVEAAPLPQKAGGIPASRRFLRRVKSALLRWDVLYRFSLKLKFGAGRHGVSPGPASPNRTLQTRSEWSQAFSNTPHSNVPL